MLLAVLVLEDAGPCDPECSRQLPAHCRIVKPDANKVADSAVAIRKGLTAVQNPHVVDEAKIPPHHARLELMLASDEVDGVEGLSLGFGEAGNARAARLKRGVADKKSPGEGHDDPGVVVEEDRAGVGPRVTEEAEATESWRTFVEKKGRGGGCVWLWNVRNVKETYVSKGQSGADSTWIRSGRVAAISL